MVESTDTDTFESNASKFNYIKPSEALRGFEITIVNLGETESGDILIKLLTFPDLDKKPLVIPLFANKASRNQIDDVLTAKLREMKEVKVSEIKLDSDKKERLLFCLNELKLPTLLAVHLAINRADLSLDNFDKPGKDIPPTIFLSISGDRGTGKSMLAATLSLTTDTPVFTLDQFSYFTPDKYLESFKKKGFSETSSAGEIFSIVKQLRRNRKSSENLSHNKKAIPKKLAKPMRKLLDELLESFKNDERPELIIIEDVAARTEPAPEANIYDLVGTHSTEAAISIKPTTKLRKAHKPVSLQYGVSYVTNKPLTRPYLALLYEPDFSKQAPPELRPQVLESALIQFKQERFKITKEAQKFRGEFINSIT